MTITRRRFLTSTLGAAALTGPFGALGARPVAAARPAVSPDYGPLAPVLDHTTGLALLSLPKGFEYISFGWTRDPMSGGLLTPSSHDGMAAFRLGDTIHLVRNHERGNGVGAFVASPYTYDPRSGGGTTKCTAGGEAVRSPKCTKASAPPKTRLTQAMAPRVHRSRRGAGAAVCAPLSSTAIASPAPSASRRST